MSSHVRVLRLMFMANTNALFEAKIKSKSTCFRVSFYFKD